MEIQVALGRTGVMNTPAGRHYEMKVVEFEAGRSVGIFSIVRGVLDNFRTFRAGRVM
jgi:hypothetical protein